MDRDSAAQSAARSRAMSDKPLDGDDVTIVYVDGGGRSQWVPNLVQDLVLSPSDGAVRLYNVHADAAKRNA